MGKRKTAGSKGNSFPLPKGKFASVIAGYSKKRGRFKGGEGFIRCAAALLCFPGFPMGGENFACFPAHLTCVSAVGLAQFLWAHQNPSFHLDQSLQAHPKPGFSLCLHSAMTFAVLEIGMMEPVSFNLKINTPKRHYCKLQCCPWGVYGLQQQLQKVIVKFVVGSLLESSISMPTSRLQVGFALLLVWFALCNTWAAWEVGLQLSVWVGKMWLSKTGFECLPNSNSSDIPFASGTKDV